MIIELTDGEYDSVTTALEDGVDFDAVVASLMGQFAIALQLHLQESNFRVCHICGEWRYTWRFNDDGTLNESDPPAVGPWVCDEHLTLDQLAVINADEPADSALD